MFIQIFHISSCFLTCKKNKYFLLFSPNVASEYQFSFVNMLNHILQDEELDISPVELDEALVIEEDDISDDEDDDHDDVGFLFFYRSSEMVDVHFIFSQMLI